MRRNDEARLFSALSNLVVRTACRALHRRVLVDARGLRLWYAVMIPWNGIRKINRAIIATAMSRASPSATGAEPVRSPRRCRRSDDPCAIQGFATEGGAAHWVAPQKAAVPTVRAGAPVAYSIERGGVMRAALKHEEAPAWRADPRSTALIKAAVAEACAPALIALGALLTVVWSGALLWLAVWALLVLV